MVTGWDRGLTAVLKLGNSCTAFIWGDSRCELTLFLFGIEEFAVGCRWLIF